MSENRVPSGDQALLARLSQIEERLSRLEAHLGTVAATSREDPRKTDSDAAAVAVARQETQPSPQTTEDDEREFEFMVGQSWFARVGIVVLALGAAFTLSLPFPDAHPALPSSVALVVVGVLLGVAHLGRRGFALVSSYLRGVALALLYFATLRLFFFGPKTVASIEAPGSRALLAVVVTIIAVVGLLRASPYLVALALAAGYTTAAVVGAPAFVFTAILVLSGLAAFCRIRRDWAALLPFAIAGSFVTHLLWALGNPLLGNTPRLVPGPYFSVAFIPAYMAILGLGSIFRRDRSREDPLTVLCAAMNCGLGYGLLLFHTAASFPTRMVGIHLAAALVLVALATAFWSRERSRASTFFYAMTGYAALSVALMKAVPPPNVFVWLSMQSLLVVGTALWFRSRFIVVANFFIYLVIVFGYVLTVKAETGISLGFGLVALLTARALNWQQQRLELKTEAMRNAYLACALLVFPYALFHLVPRVWVAVAWVGVAVVYYLLNLVVRSQKYRWMGHVTLLATALYVVIVGTVQLDPFFRILSFGVLGTVLVVVSLVFTRLRTRQRASPTDMPTAHAGTSTGGDDPGRGR